MPAECGMATLVAFAWTLEANAQDDALDVLDRLLTDLLARVDKQERQRRLRTIGDLDTAALLLRDISLVVLDRATSEHTVRHEIFARVSRERIEQAIATVGALARPPENAQAPETLLSRYSTVRQFLPLLLGTIAPHATTAARPCWRPGNFCIVSSAPHRHRCTRRRCASSRQPGGGWWCVR